MSRHRDGRGRFIPGPGGYITPSQAYHLDLQRKEHERMNSHPDPIGVPYHQAVLGPDGTYAWAECPAPDCAAVVQDRDGLGAARHWEESHGLTAYLDTYPSGRLYAACGMPHPSGDPTRRCSRRVQDGLHVGRQDVGHGNDRGNQWA